YSFTFSTPGTYKYYCRQHLLQGMTATITVTPP
ncbi:MAG TPA: plastocyanin/azurin family copper-binding protein, partial [Dehalococcoidia bacterium]